jgi:hypothetical protein
MVEKIRRFNRTDINVVRVRGIHFDPHFQFSVDVERGDRAVITDVPDGVIALTAYRVSDQVVLGTIAYRVSDTRGFNGFLFQENEGPENACVLVGEAFVIE